MKKIFWLIPGLLIALGCGKNDSSDGHSGAADNSSLSAALIVGNWNFETNLCTAGSGSGERIKAPQDSIALEVSDSEYKIIEQWKTCYITSVFEIVSKESKALASGIRESALIKSKKRRVSCAGHCGEKTISYGGESITLPICEEKSGLDESDELDYFVDGTGKLSVEIVPEGFYEMSGLDVPACGYPVMEYRRQ